MFLVFGNAVPNQPGGDQREGGSRVTHYGMSTIHALPIRSDDDGAVFHVGGVLESGARIDCHQEIRVNGSVSGFTQLHFSLKSMGLPSVTRPSRPRTAQRRRSRRPASLRTLP